MNLTFALMLLALWADRLDVAANDRFHLDHGFEGDPPDCIEGNQCKEDDKKVKTTMWRNDITRPEWEINGYPTFNKAGIDFWNEHVAFHQDGYHSTGFSYYLRAFNMFPRWYTHQFGWGQWAKAGFAVRDRSCARSPRRMTCHDVAEPFGPGAHPVIQDETNGFTTDCTWPEGDERLHNCQYQECRNEDQHIYGTFEGGMGYWRYYTKVARRVKWMGKFKSEKDLKLLV